MKKEKIIIVLDTETCGGMSSPLVYDLGYVVATTKGEILKTRSYIIKQTFNNKKLFETAYYKEKRPLYIDRLNNKYSKLVYLGYALNQLLKDMNKYNITDLYAYNSSFDKRSIKSSVEKFNTKQNPAKEIIDIMDFIKVITDTKEYKEFCKNNNFMTKHKKPQPQKKAETLKRYLDNNPNYIEEHTALEDSKIELEILLKALGLGE